MVAPTNGESESRMLQPLIMTLMLISALACFATLMSKRVRLLVDAKPAPRLDRYPERAMAALKFAIGQWRMPRDPIAGFAHIFIFGGFMVVSLATIQHFVSAYAPGWQLFGDTIVSRIYSLVKDVFELLVLVGVTYGLWRRLKTTPSRVGRSWEGVFVLCMIGSLMLTDFLTFGGELASAGASGMPWNPAGHAAAQLLSSLSPEAAHLVGKASWWVHCALVLVFLNFLPIGKHFHVITGIPNVFFQNLGVGGALPVVDVEAAMEKGENVGLKTTADLPWNIVLNVYSCTECGRCNVYCPTVLTGKPLSHRQVNLDMKQALYADADARALAKKEGKEPELGDLVGRALSADALWACTTCGSCEQECPVFIEQVPRIIQMRQTKALMEGDVPPELQRAYQGLERNQNPWGIGSDKRDEWASGLEIPRMADVAGEGEPPLLYWIGCAGSFDDRNKKITLAMVKILKAAGVPFAILGKEECCTGDPARRTGNEYLFQILAKQNIELLNGYNVKKVLTSCPHCLHTLKADYPQFGGNYEVVHHTQLIEQLLASGRLKLTREVKTSVALHDSCYLGRYHDIYEAPRNVVKSIPGASLVELPRNRSRSVCCGAGGGRFWMEEHIGKRINVHRAEEAVAAGTDTVASACPFCLVMLKDGVGALGKDETVRTRDIVELVAEALVTDTQSGATT